MTEHATNTDTERCPDDGQTRAYHEATDPGGTRTNAEFMGCHFFTETDAELTLGELFELHRVELLGFPGSVKCYACDDWTKGTIWDHHAALAEAHFAARDAAVRAEAGVLGEVAAERARQDAKWGEQNHPNGTGGGHYAERAEIAKATTDRLAELGRCTYRAILDEEVAEAFAEDDPRLLRAELIQVAAVAVAWVEKIDRDALRAAFPGHEEEKA